MNLHNAEFIPFYYMSQALFRQAAGFLAFNENTIKNTFNEGCSYMSMKEDFKKFAMRGNVMDMAVGVIIGGAFGKIVSSLVNDVVMPPLGMALGKMDFSNLFISLNGKEYATLEAAKKAGAPVLAYGSFINSVLDFLILAFVIFMMIRQINKLTPEPEPAPEPRLCPYCKSEIADDATPCPHCTSHLE